MSHAISQSLLPEFDHEMATTRRVLERVPEDRLAFRPHPKSMAMDRLAGHVSEIPWWALVTLSGAEFDANPVNGPKQTAATMVTRAETLAAFDAKVQEARALLAGTTDAAMMETWSLKNAGKTVIAMPRLAVLRSFVMNHLIHHRAQLAVYLRMNDVPVPSIYGPSADEGQLG